MSDHAGTDPLDVDAILAGTTRALRPLPRTMRPQSVFAELAATTDSELAADFYGEGDVVAALETRVAELLGKPAAVLMPSGTMAQQIALRVWADRAGRRTIGLHPTSHVELHEERAYEALHGLRGVMVGDLRSPMDRAALDGVAEPLAALLIELPMRELGGWLPTWDELQEIVGWARERDVAVHVDGARLWETQPYYGRRYAEIAAVGDTVYVSLYKLLGGVAGAVLAGPDDVIAEARIWRRRHGGTLVHLHPFALSAQLGLDRELPAIAEYVARCAAIAAAISRCDGVRVTPDPPPTNMCHVFIEGDRERLERASLEVARDTGTLLFRTLGDTDVPGVAAWELVVGRSAGDLTPDEVADTLRTILERARG